MDEVRILDKIPSGTVTPPPSKSISHRALICAALADGVSVIENIELSDDVSATIGCIKALGVHVAVDKKTVTVHGGIKAVEHAVLDCGESGSTLRFMLPIALMGKEETILIGHGRLMQRPMEEYKRALEENGASVIQTEECIKVRGPIRAGTYRFSGSVSSQFVTGLLFALPLLAGDSEILLTSPLESKAYVDLTIDAMKAFGVNVTNEAYERFVITGAQKYLPSSYQVETDFSAAAFFLAAGALGCDVGCLGLNPHSLQGDRDFIDILKQCGIGIEQSKDGAIRAVAGKIKAVTVDVSDIPDLVPPLTSLLCFCEGKSEIINAARLRLKESDRLHALAVEFNKLGADITEGEDHLIIQGVTKLHGGKVDAHNDHRIAMALAAASLRSDGTIELSGADAVKKSYPNFWNDFCKIERSISHE